MCILNGKQCRSRSVGFFRSQLIWFYTVYKGMVYLGSAGQWLIYSKGNKFSEQTILGKQANTITEKKKLFKKKNKKKQHFFFVLLSSVVYVKNRLSILLLADISKILFTEWQTKQTLIIQYSQSTLCLLRPVSGNI